jgi:hypothetical protein
MKRIGRAVFDLEEAEDRYGLESVEELTPEKIFDAILTCLSRKRHAELSITFLSVLGPCVMHLVCFSVVGCAF